MENYAKMHPKWEPQSIQNLKNTGKNGIRKLMPKFDAKKPREGPGTAMGEALSGGGSRLLSRNPGFGEYIYI